MGVPDSTLGGYWQKHSRPPAFEGSDSAAYSVEIYIGENLGGDEPFGAALLFVRWSEDGAQPAGHLETDYLVRGGTRSEVKAALQQLTLVEAREHLDTLIARATELPEW